MGHIRYSFPQFGPLLHRTYAASRIRAVAHRIREMCEQQNAKTFDPFECAKYFGIETRLVALPQNLSGRIRFDLDMPTIEMNSGQSTRRHRFTVCHEMAHLTFLSERPALSHECEFFECNLIDKREED